MRGDTLTIAIPAYNEEDSIEDVLRECVTAFQGDDRPAEVIVINDRSRDRTAEVVGAFSAHDSRIRLIDNPTQMGCIPSTLRGFGEATGAFCFFLPGDGQIAADVARRCLDIAGDGADIVLTRRRTRRDPLLRRLASRVYNRIVRMIVPTFPASDIDSSSLFRRELLDKLPPPGSTSSFALVELVLQAQASGARVEQVDIGHRPRSAGRATGLRPRELMGAARGLRWLLEFRGRIA
jgi:glycosyltransferase involved in cell wall biosynthesis